MPVSICFARQKFSSTMCFHICLRISWFGIESSFQGFGTDWTFIFQNKDRSRNLNFIGFKLKRLDLTMVSKISKFISKVPRPFPNDVGFLNSSRSWIHDGTSVLARRRTRSPISWRNIWKHGRLLLVLCIASTWKFRKFLSKPWLSDSLLLPFFPKTILKIFEPLEPFDTSSEEKNSHFWNLLPTSKSWHPPEPGAVKSPRVWWVFPGALGRCGNCRRLQSFMTSVTTLTAQL